MSKLKIVNFRNIPVVSISDELDCQPFTFGLRKAEMVIEHLKEIKEFIKEFPKLKKNLKNYY